MNHEDKFARAEVEIIGVLSEREMYCFTPRYVLTAIQIKPIGSLEVVDSSALTNEVRNSYEK
ncbi:MAG: hypothetical protein H7Z37_18265 [Pyrinomonadaceae bacterium]|nr:hypothetical protein [Pyrinomonadaceae bacterium]